MKLLERVLVASDLGPHTQTLAASISDFLHGYGSQVLLHYTAGRLSPESFMDRDEASPEARWESFSQELLKAGVRRVDFDTSCGNPSHSIERAAEEFGATLIVISEGPELRSGQVWFGTVAQRLSRRVKVPLLVAPAGSPVIMRPLLCLVDSSDSSREALTQAASLCRALETSLTILHVVPECPTYPVVEGPLWASRSASSAVGGRSATGESLSLFSSEDADIVGRTEELQRTMKARREVEFIMSQVDLSGFTHELLLLHGSPVSQCLSVAHLRHHGMILIGADHSSGLTHLTTQGSADALISVADIPVMVCHGQPRKVRENKVRHAGHTQLDAGL